MPLSEQEQRLLEEMERSLYHNDADFVATVSTNRGRPNYRLIAIGALIALLGIGTIVTGVVIKQPIVGMLGFIVVLAGALLAIATPRGSSNRQADPMDAAPRPSSPGKAKAGFMDRMNERWDRRQDERDQ